MSEFGVIAKELKNDLAQALAKFGDANRSESVQTVMAHAMTIRNTLVKDPEFRASKAIADAQKKDIDAFQAIIKEGMNGIEIGSFTADGTKAEFATARKVLLSEVAKADPQALLEFIRNGGLDGTNIKAEDVADPRLRALVVANTVEGVGSLRFKD